MISSVMYTSDFYREEIKRYRRQLLTAMADCNYVEFERLLRWIEVTEEYLEEAKEAGI
jgi:hypothetical protein